MKEAFAIEIESLRKLKTSRSLADRVFVELKMFVLTASVSTVQNVQIQLFALLIPVFDGVLAPPNTIAPTLPFPMGNAASKSAPAACTRSFRSAC